MNTIDTNNLPVRERIMLQEIRSQALGITNKLVTRRQHPSYGVTKTMLRTELAELRGMLFAFGILKLEDHGTASVGLLAQATADAINLDIKALAQEVEAA